MAFITAGADVCAINGNGLTPSHIAQKYNREDKWSEALTLCGYDPEVVFAQSGLDSHDPLRISLTPGLSFQQFCRNRQEYLEFKKICFGEYCQSCGDELLHDFISFEECCQSCKNKLQARKTSPEGHYQTWRANYLMEKAFYKRLYEEHLARSPSEEEKERLVRLPPEEEEAIVGTNDESDDDGCIEISDGDEFDDDMNIHVRPTNHDAETTQGDDRNGKSLEGGGHGAHNIDIDLEEAEGDWNQNPMEDVGNRGLGLGDCADIGFTGSDLNPDSSVPDDEDIFEEFCNL